MLENFGNNIGRIADALEQIALLGMDKAAPDNATEPKMTKAEKAAATKAKKAAAAKAAKAAKGGKVTVADVKKVAKGKIDGATDSAAAQEAMAAIVRRVAEKVELDVDTKLNDFTPEACAACTKLMDKWEEVDDDDLGIG